MNRAPRLGKTDLFKSTGIPPAVGERGQTASPLGSIAPAPGALPAAPAAPVQEAPLAAAAVVAPAPAPETPVKASPNAMRVATAAEVAPVKTAPAPVGRPATLEEWTKVTVVLFNRQIVFLDRLANDIRAKTGAAIRRAEILRALVDALQSEGIDLSGAKSEAELKALLRARLRA